MVHANYVPSFMHLSQSAQRKCLAALLIDRWEYEKYPLHGNMENPLVTACALRID